MELIFLKLSWGITGVLYSNSAIFWLFQPILITITLHNQCLLFFPNSSSPRPDGTQHVVFRLGGGIFFIFFRGNKKNLLFLDKRQKKRFLIFLSKSPLIILDGAHNLNASRNLAKYLVENLNKKKTTLVIRILDDKPYRTMLKSLLPMCHRVILPVLKLTVRCLQTSFMQRQKTSIPIFSSSTMWNRR